MCTLIASALLLSLCVASGTAPRLAPSMAMQAILIGSGHAGHHEPAAEAPSLGSSRSTVEMPGRDRLPSASHAIRMAHAAAVPGRGDLPPPVLG